ncbi:MAG: LysM peptidoglycan-binding domain-containing protein [Planctomycetota bacterium]|nr:LysM peptidoglycan-binding domain-containing protein [Planctomycetota bacterium]
MKRDARIGLAVVLVLGLAVTLLIAQSVCKRGGETADADSAAPRGAAAYTTDVARVDGIDAAQVSAAAAATPSAAAPADDTAARASDASNPALKKFTDDQTRKLSAEAQPAPAAALKPAPADAAATADHNSKPSTGDSTPPSHGASHTDHTALLDHEQSGPPAADHKPPADGFGYTVAAGDNIWKISTKVYGDGKYSQKIIEANAGLNTLKMKPGTILRIPVIANKTILTKMPTFADAKKGGAAGTTDVADRAKPHSADAASGPATASKPVTNTDKAAGTASATTTHKVEAGDTLSAIAKKYFGTSGPKTIALIAAANKGLDPAKLKVGQELTIPAKK